MITNEYAAGLFDGEGCVASYFHSGKYAQVGAKVVMTDPRPLNALAEKFGGAVKGPIPQGTGHKPQFVWMVYSQTAKVFFRAIEPHSIVKREQIICAIQLLDLIGGRGAPKRNMVTYFNAEQRESLVNQIRSLNARRFEEVA